MKLQNLIHIPFGIVLVQILAGIPASLGLAENLKTINGKEYKDARISRVEPDGIVLLTKSGVSKVYFNELPRDVQERFHNGEPAKVEAELTVAINEERKKKDPEAEAIIVKAEEEFQTAEIQAAYAYEGSEKGTLSGQIFVATKGGENRKLGALPVSLFASDAIADLLSGLNAFTTAKSKQLELDISVARTRDRQASITEEQAEEATAQSEATERRRRELYDTGYPLSPDAAAIVANDKQGVSDANAALKTAREAATAAREGVQSLLAERAYYHSYPFYFSHLRYPIRTAETDGEGKFVIQVPLNGKFVIAVQTQRTVGNETERYYWLQPVSLDGQRQGVQNLSNSNVMLMAGAD
jgi:hypothetical protein